MAEFEKTVSNFVESQFPSFYYEEGPQFIAFMKAYYEWMEEQGPIYHSRRLIDYRNIDTTVDDFLIHFKKKYLSGIILDTAVETERVIKHALDMYRSKGTERAIDLFFKNLFGVSAEIYYPGDDVFKTSDGKWFVPEYLEVADSENAADFIGLQIEGVESGATAYIDKYIVKKHKGTPRYSFLYYINRPVGTFARGERIRSTRTGAIGPVVLGSVNSLTVIGSSSGYEVGDIVDFVSDGDGIDGKARVTSIVSDSGKINFTLTDGGWGFRSNSQVYVSEKVLTVGEIEYDGENFTYLETIAQPMVNVTYSSANGTFEVGDTIVRSNDDTAEVYSVGTVLSVNSSSNSFVMSVSYGKADDELDIELEDGSLLADESGIVMLTESLMLANSTLISSFGGILDEDLDSIIDEDGNLIIIEEPSVTANIVTFDDVSVYGMLMGISNTVTLVVEDTSITSFANGNPVHVDGALADAANGTINVVSSSLGDTTMRVINTKGIFSKGSVIETLSSNAAGIILDVSSSIGVVNIDGDFIDLDGNLIRGLSSNVVGTITRISSGTGANVSISNTFLYVKEVEINTDLLQDYQSIELDAADYGFPTAGTEDQNTLLIDAATFTSANVGRISSIITRNQGLNYDTAPFILVYEPLIARQGKRDIILDISGLTGSFDAGEVVLQANTEMGLVKDTSNSSVLYLTRLSMEDFEVGVAISGQLSGATANVTSVSVDSDSQFSGMNAIIIANTAVGEGVVSGLSIVDSGFNYIDGETVTFSADGLGDGTAEVELSGHGFSEGFYKENNGQLSGDKYIHDGEYYQEYSYEIKSAIPLEKYADILKNVIHMAGTKHFSKFVKKNIVNTEITVTSSMSTDVDLMMIVPLIT